MLDQRSLVIQSGMFVSQGRDDVQETASRILLLDSDARLCEQLAQMLQPRGCTVVASAYNNQVQTLLSTRSFDLIVLNLESPWAMAAKALRSIRQSQSGVPLIVTTERASTETAIAAVKANVVDYIVKPYQPEDLWLTISRALAERAQQLRHRQLVAMVTEALAVLKEPAVADAPRLPTVPDSSFGRMETMHAGPVELDRQKRQLIWNDEPPRTVELTESELTVMVTLMQKPNQVVSCNQLGTALGYQNMDKWTIENVIRSVVFRLRQKIETDSDGTRLIHTVRGRGYYFAPV